MGKKSCLFLKNLKLFKVKFDTKNNSNIRKNILACLFSVHNTISLSRHELVHDMMNLSY